MGIVGSTPKQVGRVTQGVAACCGFALSAATLLVTSACTSHHYMGRSMPPGEASPDVQALAHRAQAGDNRAQLDLGIRFEEGDGVPQHSGRATKLYRQAASDSGGTIWVYMPSPGNGAKGRAVPVDRGPKQLGLDDAKKRLQESADR